MLVKKKNPTWYPSENKFLKVGETIEITDPKILILGGDVTPLAEDGTTELSAYELYGVVLKDELKEFQDYLTMKKAEAMKKKLEDEKKELESQLKEKEEVSAPVAAKPAAEAKKK